MFLTSQAPLMPAHKAVFTMCRISSEIYLFWNNNDAELTETVLDLFSRYHLAFLQIKFQFAKQFSMSCPLRLIRISQLKV